MSTAQAIKVTPIEPETVYPHRNPASERAQLHADDARSFDALNHFGWNGQRDLRAGARILVVGEGNGDATVHFAEQARDTNIEIVTIEISEAAIALSKDRLAARGLTNVQHRQLSLLDLPGSDLGAFDIIECSHVLDHVEEFMEGLAALTSVLKEDGMLLLAVNGNYGRLQLYMIQALMQHLITDDMPRDLKIQIVGQFLSAVPADHWLGHDSADLIAEINQPDGSGIEALFLQKVNHLFTVGEIYQWLDSAGLALVSFLGKDRPNYEVETHVKAPMLRDLLTPKMEYERHMIADLMHGGIRAHQFYAAFEDKVPAQFADEMVISFSASTASPSEVAGLIAKTPNSAALLALIDGKRTVKEIVAALGEETRAELETLYQTLHLMQRVFLRHKTVPPYMTNAQIQARLAAVAPITYQ